MWISTGAPRLSLPLRVGGSLSCNGFQEDEAQRVYYMDLSDAHNIIAWLSHANIRVL